MPSSALPVIRGVSTALYPFTITYTALTGRQDNQNGAVTRWIRGYPLVSFQLPFEPITQAQKNTLKAAFASAKGQFTTNLSITTDQEYDNLVLETDLFEGTEKTSTKYGVQWKLSQTISQNLGAGGAASGAAYPVIGSGAICLLPYSQGKRWQTITSQAPSGARYTMAEFAGGFTGYPSDGLMIWTIDEGGLTDGEAAGKTLHWMNNWGDALPFTFTDEDGTTYSKVYYATSTLSITHNACNHCSIRTQLLQTF